MRRAREHLAWSPVVVSWCSLCNTFNQSTFYLSSALRCAAGGWWCWLCVCVGLLPAFSAIIILLNAHACSTAAGLHHHNFNCAAVQLQNRFLLWSPSSSSFLNHLMLTCCIDHLDHHLLYKAWPCLGDVL